MATPTSPATTTQRDQDSYQSNQCENGATCTNVEFGYICNCPDGFRGRFCEVPFETTTRAATTLTGLGPNPLSCASIHWKAKNNHFRFSLSIFTFFTLRLVPEKWKSDFFTFFTFTIAFEK